MRRGELAEAWRVSDEVLRGRRGRSCAALPRHFQWIWNGEPLEGKRVLVRCYHGLGDTVQFIRYASLVRQNSPHVAVWAQGGLLPLLSTVEGIDELLPLHEGTPEVDFDIEVEVMELPHVFRSTLKTLPKTVPYLHVRPACLGEDQNLLVGIVWGCGDWAPKRAIPVDLLAPLATIPHITLHLLQRGTALEDRPKGFGIDSGCDAIAEAARVIAALDLVVSIDSLPAHLAGALGVATWTLLQADADWRWMDERHDSPWYPTMRLFRQKRAGDWREVIERVAVELQRLAAEPRQRSADSTRG